MHLPLRAKFAVVAGSVAIIALGSALWALNYRLERQMAGRIGDLLIGAENTFTRWENERQNNLRIQAQIIARDPRFFAAVAEGDPATALPAARQFQAIVNSSLFLVCDESGRPLARLDHNGDTRSFSWPSDIPPRDRQLRSFDELYLLQTRAVTIGPDTVGYVALGDHVNAGLATTVAQIAGVDVLFFDDTTVFGASLPVGVADDFAQQLAHTESASSSGHRPVPLTIGGERFLFRMGRMIGGGDGYYAVVMSLDERLAPLISDMRTTLTVVGAVALVLAFLLSWVVARKITERVPLLLRSVEAVARGDYSRSVVHHGNDEFHTLAQAVDRMRAALAAQMDEIRRANEEKIAAERLAIVGKMASTIIHDFKTPMQVIRSAVEMTSVDGLPAPKREEYGVMITRELNRMVDMAQELLEFARGDRRMARSLVVVDEFLAEATASWRQIAQRQRVQIELDTGAGGVAVSIDREKILRALNNIVTNALEVLSPDGRIMVASSVHGDTVQISIADTGPGIPAEIRETIFEPFATFGKAQGTGLGLAMARKAVDDHHGTISVESGPGQGTRFIIRLPKLPDHESTQNGQQEPEVTHESTLA
ncbi:MAG: hypothetical protein Kow0074_21220 [Candidatus Zixiibacteriota bacterium]